MPFLEPENWHVKQQATECVHNIVLKVYQRCHTLMHSIFSMFLSRLYHSFKHSVYRVSRIICAIYSILLMMTYLIVGAAITYVLTFKIVSSVLSDQIEKDSIELFQIILQTVIEFSILFICYFKII